MNKKLVSSIGLILLVMLLSLYFFRGDSGKHIDYQPYSSINDSKKPMESKHLFSEFDIVQKKSTSKSAVYLYKHSEDGNTDQQKDHLLDSDKENQPQLSQELTREYNRLLNKEREIELQLHAIEVLNREIHKKVVEEGRIDDGLTEVKSKLLSKVMSQQDVYRRETQELIEIMDAKLQLQVDKIDDYAPLTTQD